MYMYVLKVELKIIAYLLDASKSSIILVKRLAFI